MTSTQDSPSSITGGCLCGAVRYSIAFDDDQFKWPPATSSCQCTMCRKAFGALYPQFLEIPSDRIQSQLKSSPKFTMFPSSPKHYRGFCSECGSTFTWSSDDSAYWALAVGTVDEEHLMAHGRVLGTPNKKQLWTQNAIPGVTDLLKGGEVHPQDDE